MCGNDVVVLHFSGHFPGPDIPTKKSASPWKKKMGVPCRDARVVMRPDRPSCFLTGASEPIGQCLVLGGRLMNSHGVPPPTATRILVPIITCLFLSGYRKHACQMGSRRITQRTDSVRIATISTTVFLIQRTASRQSSIWAGACVEEPSDS